LNQKIFKVMRKLINTYQIPDFSKKSGIYLLLLPVTPIIPCYLEKNF
jgi:hypothetical protein